MQKYLAKIVEQVRLFSQFQITRIPREENIKADELSKLITDSTMQMGCTVIVEKLTRPTIELQDELMGESEN